MEKSERYTVPNGILLIVGGHEDKANQSERKVNDTEVLSTFFKLTNKQAPLIEVFTTASSEGKEIFEDYRKTFLDMGAARMGHIHHDVRN